MSKNTGTSELINYFDLGANGDVGIAGSLDINTIANATTDTDTFLVSDTGIIKYRTGAQLLSDIGAAPATGGSYLPLAGGTMTGDVNWAQTERGLTWGFNTDGASIKFYNTGDGDTNSRLEFATLDNADEYFRWVHIPSGGSAYESMRLVPNTSGNAQLTVSGTATFSSSVTAGGKIFTSASVNDNIIEVINSDTTNGYGLYVRGGGTALNRYVARFKNGADSDVMYIASSGNVGIGTPAPNARLEVTTPTTGTEAENIRLQMNTSAVPSSAGLNFRFGSVNGATIYGVGENGSTGASSMRFYTHNGTSSAEAMRITDNRNVLIGTITDSGIKFFVQAANANWTSIYDNTASGAGGLLIRLVGGSQSLYYGAFDGVAYKFYINGSGVVYSTSTSIVGISDISLKTNIRDIDKGLEHILKLKPRKFDWINGDGNDNLGFIAQEIENVFPELVSQYKYNQFESKKALKMGDLIPSLVKAIQEQQQQIQELKNKLL